MWRCRFATTVPTSRSNGSTGPDGPASWALWLPGGSDDRRFAEGRLPPQTLARVENHALGCAICQELLSVAVGTVAGARVNGRMSDAPSAPRESQTIDSAEAATVRLRPRARS